MKNEFELEIAERGVMDIKIIGPAPAFIARLRGRHRWQMILRGKNIGRLLKNYSIPSGWAIDIDPVGLN